MRYPRPVYDRAGAPIFWWAGVRGRTFASDPGDVPDHMGRVAAGFRYNGATWYEGPDEFALSPGIGNVSLGRWRPVVRDWTITARIVAGGPVSGVQRVFSQQGDTGYWGLVVNNQQLTVLSSQDNVTYPSGSGFGPTLNDGKTHHIAAVRDTVAGRILLVLDGAVTNSIAITGSGTYAVDAIAYISSYNGGSSECFSGLIKSLSVYDYAVTVPAIRREAADPLWGARSPNRVFWFGAPPATQIVAPAIVVSTLVVGSPSLVAGTYPLAPALVGSTLVVSAASLVPGTVALAPGLIPSTLTVGAPTLTLGSTALAPTVIGSALVVGQPTLSGGSSTVVPAAIASTLAVGSPKLVNPAAPFLFDVELETWIRASLGAPAWPALIPQDVSPPGLVYTVVSSDSALNLDGPDGLRERLYQFDAWGRTRLEAVTLAERLRLSLEGYTGPMGRAWVLDATLESEGDDFAPPVNASDRPAHRRRAEYSIFFRDGLST